MPNGVFLYSIKSIIWLRYLLSQINKARYDQEIVEKTHIKQNSR